MFHVWKCNTNHSFFPCGCAKTVFGLCIGEVSLLEKIEKWGTRRLQCYRSLRAYNVSFIKIISVQIQCSYNSPVDPLLCPIFHNLFLRLSSILDFLMAFVKDQNFSSAEIPQFNAVGNFVVYTLWQPAMMEQFCADDRSKDIFHTSAMMHTFAYAEQQFLKWIVMFWYKLAIPSYQYLIFSQGYIYILMKCGLSALLNVNLAFTARQVTT